MKSKNRCIMRRALSVILALLMLLTVMPLTVFAEDTVAPTEDVAPTDVLPTDESSTEPTTDEIAVELTTKPSEDSTTEPTEKTEYKTGDIIGFGSYPQSEVTDEALKSALTSKAGSTDGWTSYNYYIESEQSDYMKYTDVEYDGEKYRGVYFAQYRPYLTTYSNSTDNSYQDNNGYSTSTIYWFRYEPMKWQVLSYDSTTGEAVVLSKNIIDSQPYSYTSSSRTIDGKTVYANNYEHSDIRTWLNDTFYNTAFGTSAKNAIVATTLDNSAYSTDYSKYDSNSTTDNVWLLSYSEVQNTAYGFTSDTTRQATGTAYALCQGLYEYDGHSHWRLRSATKEYYNGACIVDYYGWVYYSDNVYYAYNGVRPALTLNLTSEIDPTDPTTKPTVEPTTAKRVTVSTADIIASVAEKVDTVKAAKTEEGDDALVAVYGTNAAAVRNAASGAKIVDKDGKEVSDTAPLATGMKIVLDGETVEIAVLGDVDGNGEISVTDARLALRQAVSLENLKGVYLLAAKFGNDTVSVSEARKILRAAVGLESSKDWLK